MSTKIVIKTNARFKVNFPENFLKLGNNIFPFIICGAM